MNTSLCRFDDELVQAMKEANTVEAIIEMVRARDAGLCKALWSEVEARVSRLAAQRMPNVDRVEVRLFDLEGHHLGALA